MKKNWLIILGVVALLGLTVAARWLLAPNLWGKTAAGNETGVKSTEERLTDAEKRLVGTEDRLDGAEQRITGTEERLAQAEEILGGAEGFLAGAEERLVSVEKEIAAVDEQLLLPGASLIPVSTVNGSIYNVRTQTPFGDAAAYGYAVFDVTGGREYYFTASSASNVTSFPAGAFYDAEGNWLMSFGETVGTTYEDKLILSPEEAATCVLNRNNGLKTAMLKEAVVSLQQRGYSLSFADALIREAKKNPFAFAEMDKGYVTFVFDDLTKDIDLVASVFAEYGCPLVLAAIPDRLDIVTVGLTEDRGNYTAGMLARDVMAQVVSDGGEIMVHNNLPVVTEENQYDFEFMYGYFIDSKNALEAAGFKPRGILRAGGAAAVSRSAEIDRWLIGNYEYGDMGTLPQYNWDRINSNIGLDAMKAAVDGADANHTWVRFMCHGLNYYDRGEALIDEAALREMLDYCRDKDVGVVTCAYIFDHFSSSELEERVKALEARIQ